jgi:hypothetical protein
MEQGLELGVCLTPKLFLMAREISENFKEQVAFIRPFKERK